MQDTFEILLLARFWRNGLAPINRIPPEVLALLPDFLDRGPVKLTHVCRAWREIFASRSSLWTNFNCENIDKTRVYLERSKSSPINVFLERSEGLYYCDPFLQIVPHAIPRLKSLVIEGSPKSLPGITTQLSLPAPLLETLKIEARGGYGQPPYVAINPTLFGGELPSLRVLHLRCIRTELPWRNMANLTSFTLDNVFRLSSGEVSQFLDFFESAPRLRKIHLKSATPTSRAEDGRLVSLACLKKMAIIGGQPSLLLDHLLIPVGTELRMRVDVVSSRLEGHFPRSLDNLRNLPDFTDIRLYFDRGYSNIRFTGPNGRISVVPPMQQFDSTSLLLEYLAEFDTATTERLTIITGNPPTTDTVHYALLPMTNLRTLTLSRCKNLSTFIHTLHPGPTSSITVVCPKLEELVLDRCVNGKLDVHGVVTMAAMRTSRGAKLRSIRIVSKDKSVQADALELKKHVLHVECGPEGAIANDYGGSSDED